MSTYLDVDRSSCLAFSAQTARQTNKNTHAYSIVALVPPMSTTDVWRGIT